MPVLCRSNVLADRIMSPWSCSTAMLPWSPSSAAAGCAGAGAVASARGVPAARSCASRWIHCAASARPRGSPSMADCLPVVWGGRCSSPVSSGMSPAASAGVHGLDGGGGGGEDEPPLLPPPHAASARDTTRTGTDAYERIINGLSTAGAGALLQLLEDLLGFRDPGGVRLRQRDELLQVRFRLREAVHRQVGAPAVVVALGLVRKVLHDLIEDRLGFGGFALVDERNPGVQEHDRVLHLRH